MARLTLMTLRRWPSSSRPSPATQAPEVSESGLTPFEGIADRGLGSTAASPQASIEDSSQFLHSAEDLRFIHRREAEQKSFGK